MMEIIGGVFGIRPAGDVVRHPFGDRQFAFQTLKIAHLLRGNLRLVFSAISRQRRRALGCGLSGSVRRCFQQRCCAR